MIQPPPFKLKCPKCGYSKIVRPKSDALNPMEMIGYCPKCNTELERKELNFLDNIINKFNHFAV